MGPLGLVLSTSTYVEILYCTFFVHRPYAMLFASSLRLIGLEVGGGGFVLVICTPFLRHCARLTKEEG